MKKRIEEPPDIDSPGAAPSPLDAAPSVSSAVDGDGGLRESLRREIDGEPPRRKRGRPRKIEAVLPSPEKLEAIQDAAEKLLRAVTACAGVGDVPPETAAWGATVAFGRLVALKWLGRLDWPWVEEVGLGVSLGTYIYARRRAAATHPDSRAQGVGQNTASNSYPASPPGPTSLPLFGTPPSLAR